MTDGREQIEFDVLFVGGGPANLAGAIRLMQLAKGRGISLEVAMIEKGADIGSHAVSGAVLNPSALRELVPAYKEQGCPIEKDVRGDEFYLLTERSYYRLPFVPKDMHNEGCHIISLAKFVQWLGKMAENLGVNVFPGFAGKEVIFAENGGAVLGVRTGDKGLAADGTPKANFEPGVDILAKVTVFGEGPKGSLIRDVAEKLDIFSGRLPQLYETGIKEVIQLPQTHYFQTSSGNDIHTMGYPLGLNTHGGGFAYEMKENRVALGLIIGLAYSDPMLDLYNEFIKFKRHPLILEIIRDGRVIEQGARVIGNGGYYTIPQLSVDGGVFVGGSASMLNAPALKGIHTAMKSGMLAAETILDAHCSGRFTAGDLNYERLLRDSWLGEELYRGRNFAQGACKEGLPKFFHLGAQYVTGGRGFIDPIPSKEDSRTLRPLNSGTPVRTGEERSRHFDGVLYVDKLTGVYLSKTQHREDQPCHLIVHDRNVCANQCFEQYRCPCTRFCPGGVYEMEIDETTQARSLKLNPSNCLHCKTCEVKDPFNNITWTCPEGGEGPKYTVL